MAFVNLGTRNKGTLWEYGSAYSFLNTRLPHTKYKVPLFFSYGEGSSNKHCHEESIILATQKLLIKEFKAGVYDESFFKELMEMYTKRFDELKLACSSDFIHDSNEVLAKKCENAFYSIVSTHPPMLLALKTMYLNEFFKEELKKVLNSDEKDDQTIQEQVSFLLTTPQLSFVQQEEAAIFDIIREYKLRGIPPELSHFEMFCQEPDISIMLDSLVRDYGWFHMEYSFEPFVLSDYISIIWERISAGNFSSISPAQIVSEVRKKQKDFFIKHPSKKFQELAIVLQNFAWILDHSKVITVHGIYLSRPLFREVGKRIGLSWSDLLYLTMPEIIESLKMNKKIDGGLIEKRKKCRAILLKDEIIRVYEGKEAKDLAKKLLIQEKEIISEKEIRGIVGYPGKIRGKVSVVHSLHDRDKFKKGDILVTHDGSAELTLFLKNASAIVTDEGGMICHATIVAREIKTPCIVGTKNATKIFKDGDLVEVDATKGVVRKL